MTQSLTPSAAVLKTVRALRTRKNREKLGLALVEGTRLVQSAILGGASIRYLLVSASFVATERDTESLWSGQAAGLERFEVSNLEFDRLSAVETSQGILAVIEAEWTDDKDVVDRDSIVVLDAVQDPGNAGAIIRSAAWFGVDAVVAGPGTVDLYSPKVLRASMGGIWDVVVARSSNLVDFLIDFRASGGTLLAAAMTGVSHDAWVPPRRTAIVFGNEGRGITADVEGLGLQNVTIPRVGRSRSVESLNVSVAAGILLDRLQTSKSAG